MNNDNLSYWRGFFIGAMAGAAFVLFMIRTTAVKADETIPRAEVQSVADRVGVVLILRSFTVDTHDLLPAVVTQVPALNGRPLKARTYRGRIEIDEDQPEGCRVSLLAHELTEALIPRAYGARRDTHEIANAVMAAVGEYAPNCLQE